MTNIKSINIFIDSCLSKFLKCRIGLKCSFYTKKKEDDKYWIIVIL